MTGPLTSRRTALAAGAAAGLAVTLAACGSDDDNDGAPTGEDTGGGTDTGTDPGTEEPGQDGGTDGGTDGGEQAGGEALARTSDVPVGGGLILAEQKVVVTQPEEGTFKAFSAVCTHRGCTVGSVSEGHIVCPCHDSMFAIADGAPTPASPAKAPLPEEQITVEGEEIRLG
ncbi:Rieske (2Fe-2S) protein [Streptomyces aidingensis]|uniref:Ferredoxin subunit of nitrite reductase or a ring-hydroxylating dioxygenase n=1 Tax=Streptomyces aidingensis TaxID=910347 RepID=A0A1I1PH61_9ACTN|nr:Rieske (2Fe-2S) protein [Streptomyces aidingensis]SFD08986.1 Ferredoxin subunit of nitrite reductase or a ring-hydroxylating dioxygenase [Streptomyces aidingensis]